MEPDPKSARDAAPGLRALAQPVAAPLTRAAIFLVVTPPLLGAWFSYVLLELPSTTSLG